MATTRRLGRACVLGAVLMSVPSFVSAQVLYSLRADGTALDVVDAATRLTLSSVPLAIPGETVTGGGGLGVHPTTGTLWALLTLGSFGLDPELVTIDPCTGDVTRFGDVGTNYTGLAFDAAGTLYSASALFEPVASRLVTLQTDGTPDPTVLLTLAQTTHHVLAFDAATGLLIHAAPGVLEGIDPDTLATQPLSTSGDPLTDQLTALADVGGSTFIGGGQFGTLYRITAGLVDDQGAIEHPSFGFAAPLAGDPCVPPTSSTSSTTTTASITTTTSTTAASSTTTTLPGGCPGLTRFDCSEASRAMLEIDARRPGRERLAVTMSRFSDGIGGAQIGDPVHGDTAYRVCIYGIPLVLVGELEVDRAGQICGGKPCWSAAGAHGYRYQDAAATADGVARIGIRTGSSGRGKLRLTGYNRAASGATSLPTGVAAVLASTPSVGVQVSASDGTCVGFATSRVRVADGQRVKAVVP